MESIVIAPPRFRWAVGLLLALGLVAAGVFVVLNGDEWAGWIGIVYFGGCALVVGIQAADARPRIVIDERGIFDRTLRVGVIEWEDVRDVHPPSARYGHFVPLDLRDPDKYVRRLSPLMRRLVAMNRRAGFADFSLNLAGTGADPARVVEVIRREIAARDGAARV
ncbi:MAG: STM3941 family protein [Gemmatimonadota bacterium]